MCATPTSRSCGSRRQGQRTAAANLRSRTKEISAWRNHRLSSDSYPARFHHRTRHRIACLGRPGRSQSQLRTRHRLRESSMTEPKKISAPTLTEKPPVRRTPSPQEESWEHDTLAPVLEKNPERQAQFTTISGHPIRRLYSEADLSDWKAATQLGFPGEAPYTRGIHSTMHRGRFWTMRQFAGFGAAEDTNQRFRYLLSQGQTGLSTAFDLPTLMGYDSDHALSEGEVGKCGVAISSLADMEVLFDQIPLANVTTSMTINSPAAVIWAMYLA